MPFKRKETDYPIQTKAYKFRVFPEFQKPDFDGEIKEGIFREARLRDDVWNRLVEIRNTALENYQLIYDEEKPISSDRNERLSAKDLRSISPVFKERVFALWENYQQRIKAVADDPLVRANVSWETREELFSSFERAHKMALKMGGEVHLQPQFIRQFHFYHRFTRGGLDAAKFFSRDSKKLSIESVPDEHYTNEHYQNRLKRVSSGIFGAGINDRLQIPFRIVLHRQIPKNAKIKTSILTGKFKNGVWNYFLVLAVDEPLPISVPDSQIGRIVAGLDLGWRKFGEYIRFGVLADSAGNLFEFRLPINPPKKQSLRRLEKMLAKHGKQTQAFPQSWQDIEDFQTKNDLLIEETKEKLRGLTLPPNERLKPILDNLVKVRKSGLLRLLRALVETEESLVTESDAATGRKILQNWFEEYSKQEKAIGYARERLINDRNHKYQMIAKWLKTNYAELAYNDDLRLQETAVNAAHISLLEKNGAMMKNSAKFRVRVSLNELLRWIKQKDQKGEEWLHPKKSAFSVRCRICGGECPKTADLYIVCENGHKADQDVQAARHLRSETAAAVALKPVIIIPEQLKNIIVPLVID